MAWKPKKLLGKIIKGVAIAGAAVGGVALIAATGGTATPAVAAGGKFFGKIIGVTAKAAGQVGKGVSAVAKGATNLVSGLTAEQREMVREQKAETRTDLGVLKTIQKLINAGATAAEAAATTGVPLSELQGLYGIPSAAAAVEIEKAAVEPVTAGQGCMVTTLMFLAAGTAIAGIATYMLIL